MSSAPVQNPTTSERLIEAIIGELVVQQVSRLRPVGRQARTHSDTQIEALAKSIQQFGFNVPLVIDEQQRVLAGMGRLRAAKLLKMQEVPCVAVTHLTPELKRAFILAENRLAELAGWDRDILGLELKELSDIELGFDLTVTGFSNIQIEAFGRPIFDSDGDEAPPPPLSPSARLGDVWEVGGHRMVCGDALQSVAYDMLMVGERARVSISDPPFNVPIKHNVTTKLSHREFPMASGEMDDDQFVQFLTRALERMCAALCEGGLLYVVMDWRHSWHLLSAARALSLEQINLCVWNKGRGGMGSYYRSQHELFFIFKSGEAQHLNRVELGRHGRNRTNVWDYPGAIGVPPKGGEEQVPHPTPKNLDLLCDLLKDCTERGDIVLDPFGGGGSLLMAAERTGRRARIMELDPIYIDVMIERWQRFSGRQAILASTGQSFAEVVAERAAALTAPAMRIRRRSAKPGVSARVRVRQRGSPPLGVTTVRTRHRSSTPCVEG